VNKPIIIDTEWIRPFDAGATAMPCMTCSGDSRWIIGKPPNNYFSCARCFLYSSPWGKENRERIGEFVVEVEGAINKKISDDGIVWSTEADRILSSIVAVSGIARARAQRRLRDESSGSRS
jgi:hypothetical protein